MRKTRENERKGTRKGRWLRSIQEGNNNKGNPKKKKPTIWKRNQRRERGVKKRRSRFEKGYRREGIKLIIS